MLRTRTRLIFFYLLDSLRLCAEDPMTHSLLRSVTHHLQIVPYNIITDVTMTHTDSCLLTTYVIMTHTD